LGKGHAGNPIDYAAAVSGALQLVPDAEALKALEADYRKMADDGILLGDAEPFADLMKRCADLERRANAKPTGAWLLWLSSRQVCWTDPWDRRGAPVHYVDPYNCTKDDIDVFFDKHHKFRYQREYRCAWIPSGQSISALQPFFVELGSMRDICQLVVLDIA
jgi:hypothetical protein